MKIGLVGFPGTGKTTVFNALTGLEAETGYGATRGRTNLGVVKVPDGRIDALKRLYNPKKTTYAEITFADVAADPSVVRLAGSTPRPWPPCARWMRSATSCAGSPGLPARRPTRSRRQPPSRGR